MSSSRMTHRPRVHAVAAAGDSISNGLHENRAEIIGHLRAGGVCAQRKRTRFTGASMTRGAGDHPAPRARGQAETAVVSASMSERGVVPPPPEICGHA